MLLELIDPSRSDYAERLRALGDRTASYSPDVDRAVAEIVAAVRARGDAAVAELTRKFDKRDPRPDGGYEIPRSEWQQAADSLPGDIVQALEHAARRVRDFHEGQVETSYEREADGVRLGLRVVPLRSAGLYVPGGTALYPSSVLMNALPAKVAGVPEVVMVTPGASPEALAAALIAGVDRVFEIGGAQAVAALAYGTETVPRVDKIVGPGNQYVASAKRLVFGDVDIDSIAGPSEVLILADDSADPRFVAADLLAQAEHDVEARPILVTTAAPLVDRVEAELERQLADLPRASIARTALERYGVAVVCPNLDDAVLFANTYAPEHLEVQTRAAAAVADRLVGAGALFVGPYTAEAAGDYLAGPNHVLPTAGAARYASPLGVYDFRKRISVLEYTREGLAGHAADIVRLADVEGLHAHGRSVAMRVADVAEAAGTGERGGEDS